MSCWRSTELDGPSARYTRRPARAVAAYPNRQRGDQMKRLIVLMGLIGFSVVAVSPAIAGQCPKLIAQVNQEAGARFDGAAAEARTKAAQADKLHKEGKH